MVGRSKCYFYALVGVSFFIFFVTLLLALTMPETSAPDEAMRNDIPEWIYKNGVLPVGNEEELISNVWGFSYGFVPYLPSLLAIPFIAIFNLVYPDHFAVVLGTRLVSILSSIFSVWISSKIAQKIFNEIGARLLFSVFIVLLPQYIFVGSYHNNDAFAVLSVLLFFLFLLKGMEDHWTFKTCMGLGVAISLCVLTYYNTLAFILSGFLYCLYCCIKDDSIQRKFLFILGRVICVLCVVCVLAGWFFIRNAILHDGDFLGISAQQMCAENRALSGQFVHFPVSPVAEGVSLGEMLFDFGWLETTLKSFVGVFGYMNIVMPNYYYLVYFVIYVLGLILGVVYLLKSHRTKELFTISLCIILTVFLSIYRSYTYDYQAQGRYILPALPMVALLTTLGYEYLQSIVNTCVTVLFRKKLQVVLSRVLNIYVILFVTLLLLVLGVFFTVMLPKLSNGSLVTEL